MRHLLIATVSALVLAACNSGDTPAPAAEKTDTTTASDHTGMGHGTGTPGDAAFAASEAAMHTEMNGASGETLDEAYIAKMIAHHRGAVAMADVALAQSQDPEIRRMAQTVKDTQTVEIAQMQAWEPAAATAPPAPTASVSAAGPAVTKAEAAN